MTNPTPTTMLLTTKYICNHFEVGRFATLLPGSAAFLLFTRVHRLSKFRAYVPCSRGHYGSHVNIAVYIGLLP